MSRTHRTSHLPAPIPPTHPDSQRHTEAVNSSAQFHTPPPDSLGQTQSTHRPNSPSDNKSVRDTQNQSIHGLNVLSSNVKCNFLSPFHHQTPKDTEPVTSGAQFPTQPPNSQGHTEPVTSRAQALVLSCPTNSFPHPTTRLPRTHRTSHLTGPIPHPTTRLPKTHRQSAHSPNSPPHCEGNTAPVY